MSFIKNTKYRILTPTGFQHFDGVQQLQKQIIKFECGDIFIEVSPDHRFMIGGNEIFANTLSIGDYLEHKDRGIIQISNIISYEDIEDVFDLVEVSNGNIYYADDILHHNCHFLGSANTVIDEDVLKKLLDQPDPDIIVTNEKGNFRVYEKPIQGATYIIGCDCAKGTGEHFSTMQVCRLVSVKPVKVKQVAVFEDNYTDTYDFAALIDKTSKHYNDAYLMVENNGEGSAVISELWWTHENEGLVCTGTKTVNLGIRATTKTKPRAVILMKKLIEDGSLEIIDPPTINQLLTFVERGQNKFSGNGNPDDLVSALYWTPWIFEMDILEESMEFVKKSESNEEFWGEVIGTDDLDSDAEGYEIIQRW